MSSDSSLRGGVVDGLDFLGQKILCRFLEYRVILDGVTPFSDPVERCVHFFRSHIRHLVQFDSSMVHCLVAIEIVAGERFHACKEMILMSEEK